MSRNYNPFDWYWQASEMRIYSSKAGAVVNDTDSGYLAFLADGNHPTPWPKDDAGQMTDAALWAVLSPYGLGQKSVFTFLEFIALFTDGEKAAIVGSEDVSVKLFLLMAAGASEIILQDPRTAQGLDLMISKGLITSARKAAVLSGQAP